MALLMPAMSWSVASQSGLGVFGSIGRTMSVACQPLGMIRIGRTIEGFGGEGEGQALLYLYS
jgi:hypothetical protein